MKKIKIALGLVLCACLLTACVGSPSGTTPTDSWPQQTTQPPQTALYTLPEDNKRPAMGALMNICLSSTTDGYYTCTNVVQFCAGTSVKPITLCAQTGCAHEDSTCQAWIGRVWQSIEYQGKLYAIVSEGEFRFVEKDLSTGTITIIDRWEDFDGGYYGVGLGTIADGLAIIYVTKTTTSEQNGRPVSRQEESIWRYNLETGDKKMIFSGNQANNLGVAGLSSKHIAVIVHRPNPDQLSEAEFEAQYGENASYGRYLGRSAYRELRLYNADASICTVVASTEKDGLIPWSESNLISGKELVYQCNDTMYLLNLDTGESRAVVTMENIINFWVMDHKIFLITTNLPWYIASDPDMVVSIYAVDFDDGIPVKLGNGGNTQVMEFGISEEGTSFFIGSWNGGDYIISKEDFYADRYENAELMKAYNMN